MKKIIATLLILALAFALCACGNSQYKQAERLFAQGEFAQAAELYEAAGDYKDSADKAAECRYQLALQTFNRGEYQSAAEQFAALGDYKDSADQVTECRYQLAVANLNKGSYREAAEQFAALGDYKDSADLANESLYQQAISTFNKGDYEDAKSQFQALRGYSDSDSWIARCDQELLNARCGTYYLTGLKIDGTDYSNYLSVLGYDSYTIVFNTDGTGRLSGGGSNVSFRWDANYLDDSYDKVPYTYSGNTVTLSSNGVVMTFTR